MPMPKARAALERDRLNELARQYRKDGYDVALEPEARVLPDFLQGLHPDMVARKGAEAIVVQVKSRESLASSPELAELARRTSVVPGWRFDLVVVNPRHPPVPLQHTVFEDSDVLRRVESARSISDADPGAAVVLLWSAIEALLRRIAATSDVPVENISPIALLQQLRLYGILDQKDYDALRAAALLRNEQAHGLGATANAQMVRMLIDRLTYLQAVEVAMSSQLRKQDLPGLVHEALGALGGRGSVVDVARYIWEHYEDALQKSGDLLFTWQYDMRWAANILRRTGVMLPAESSPRGIWELSTEGRNTSSVRLGTG